MPSSDDALVLLRIAADIARAGMDPDLWPDVLKRISSSLECPTVFDADYLLSGNKCVITDRIAATAADCASTRRGRCRQQSKDDERRREKCLILVEHIELALSLGDRLVMDGERYVAVFGAIPRPLFIVDREARLLYANEAGTQELLRSPFVRCEAGFLRLVRRDSDTDLAKFLSRSEGCPGRCEDYLRLSHAEEHCAELWFRELARDGGNPGLFLVSLVTFGQSPGEASSPRGLTPRQAELAHYLLAGVNLSEAARRMGISRRTAKDHLDGLFAYSGTSSQLELVAWFTRQRMS